MVKKDLQTDEFENNPKKDSPKVNIIVPFITLNDYVLECVNNTLKLDYDNFSLILLPDVKITPPKNWISNNKIKILVTGKETISKKRNIGLKNFSDCDYYAFIDSDAYSRKDWLKNAVNSFTEEIWAVGGPNITPPSEPILKRVVGNASKSILISGTYFFRKRIAKSRFCKNLPTCNLIVSKKAIDELDGFNENLVTGEDIDLCTRIIQKNKKILYAREVVVYHHNRSLFRPFLKQRITWGFSVFKVMKENPSLSNMFLFLPLGFILFMTFLIILSFFSSLSFMIFASIGLFYLSVIFIESLRWSEKLAEIPGTFIALILGNIFPGVGSLWALLRIRKSEESNKKLIRKIYRNF